MSLIHQSLQENANITGNRNENPDLDVAIQTANSMLKGVVTGELPAISLDQKIKEEERDIIIIGDYEYDITEWKFSHPGGISLLTKYKNKDATDAFIAFHHENTHKMLKHIPRKPYDQNKERIDPETGKPVQKLSKESEELLKDWRKTVQDSIKNGLLDRTYFYYIWGTAIDLSWLVGSIYLLWHGYWFISAILLGIFYTQLAFLGHDLSHHGVFKSRTLNYRAGYIVTALIGYGFVWWKDRHNEHHALTNILETDPDVENLPLFCWDVKEISRFDSIPIAQSMIPYQKYYFWPFMPILRIYWLQSTLSFTLSLKNNPNKYYRQHYVPELSAVVTYWVWSTLILFLCPSILSALGFFFVSHLVGGFLMSAIVFGSHNTCELFAKEKRIEANWFELHVRGTRNFGHTIFEDWASGGLSYQIEHHLFPGCARPKLKEASEIVKNFCKKHNLPYETTPLLESYVKLYNRLELVGNQWRKMREAKKQA